MPRTNLNVFLTKLWSRKVEMNVNQIAYISELEGVRRIEINLERVAIWTLVFTNSFFVSYFFAKLFHWV